jgi:hypothetical protein
MFIGCSEAWPLVGKFHTMGNANTKLLKNVTNQGHAFVLPMMVAGPPGDETSVREKELCPYARS